MDQGTECPNVNYLAAKTLQSQATNLNNSLIIVFLSTFLLGTLVLFCFSHVHVQRFAARKES